MKRIILITILIAAIAVAAKLAIKQSQTLRQPILPSPAVTESSPASISDSVTPPGDALLLARFPTDRELIDRMLASYGHNARRIAAGSGLAGLRLLDELGDAAVCLFEERPNEFRQLCTVVASGANSANLVAAWGRYFDPKRANRDATAILAADLCRQPPRIRRLAEQTPEALPFLLAEPRRCADTLDRLGAEALEPLAFVDLSDGGESLRRALAVLDRHGKLAIDATEELGPAGFLLIERFGTLVAGLLPELGLRTSLMVVAAAMDDLDELWQTHRAPTLSQVMLHLHGRSLLVEAAGTRYGLRLAVNYGADGERVLETAGPGAADIVYRLYPEGAARNAVVQAIARGGVPAAVAAKKFSGSDKFCRVIERDGAPAILAVATSCTAEESRAFLASKPKRSWSEGLALLALRLAGDSGDKTVRMIQRDGMDRAQYLSSGSIEFYQFLPLFDLSHFGGVLVKGQIPTRGELVWAGLDASLVAFDAVSLLTMQPEGAVAGEATRSAVKSAAQTAAKSGSRVVIEKMTESAAERASRAAAGGLASTTARAIPARMARESEHAANRAGTELATTLSRRYGIRLVWPEVYGVLPLGGELLKILPRSRLTKYVAANVAQAGVGLLAVRKMEEYLDGRRAGTAEPSSVTFELEESTHESRK